MKKKRMFFRQLLSGALVLSMLIGSLPAMAIGESVNDDIDAWLASISEAEEPPKVKTDDELRAEYDVTTGPSGEISVITLPKDKELNYEEISRLLGDDSVQTYAEWEEQQAEVSARISSRIEEAYQLSEAQVAQAAQLFDGVQALEKELDRYSLTQDVCNMSDTTEQGVLTLIESGYTNSQATAAYAAAQVMGLDLNTLTEVQRIQLLSSEEESSQDGDAEVSEYQALAKRLGLPVSIVEDYFASGKLTPEQLEAQFKEKTKELFPVKEEADTLGAGTLAAAAANDASYAPEEEIGQPYSYEKNAELNVNLNTGDYTYNETDLTIPGRNGLDLNLTRQYNTQMASTGTPYGRFDGTEVDLAYAVSCVYYEWVNFADRGRAQPKLVAVSSSELADYTLPENYEEPLPLGFYLDDYESALAYQAAIGTTVLRATDARDRTVRLVAKGIIEGISPYFEQGCINRTRGYSYTLDDFGIGDGWRFNFPSIERYRARFFTGDYEITGDDVNYKRRLVMPDGQQYEIDFEAEEYSNLVGYTLEDMRLVDSGRGYSGASYRLDYLDGTSMYFNADGKIMAIQDAYGNEISFSYPNERSGDYSEFNITDTVGNVISYTNSGLNKRQDYYYPGHENDNEWLYNIKYTLTLNGETIREYYAYDGQYVCSLRFVINEEGEATRYNTAHRRESFNCFVQSASTNDGEISYAIMNNVTYPNGEELSLRTSRRAADMSIGPSGYQQKDQIVQYDQMHTGETESRSEYHHRKKYVFGDYSALVMPADCHYLTNVTDYYVINWRGSIYGLPQAMKVYTFNEKHEKEYEDTYVWDSVQYDTLTTQAELDAWDGDRYCLGYLEYTYNEDHLPIQIDELVYDANEQNYKTETTLYSYDTNGQVLSETKPNGQRVRYAYDTRYGVNTRILYEQDENTTIGIYNTLTTDRKAAAATEVESNRVLQAKTEYTYDTYGNCVSQKEYTSADSYNETQFVYTNGATLTETKTLDVKNADGALVSGTPGYPAGVIAQKVQYNVRGWPTAVTDANGNTTTTEYDGIGRVTKVTAPDGTSTAYSYDVEGNTVTVTDAAGGQIRNSYDYAGNLVEVRDLDANNRLTLNEYDNFNRLVESITYGGQRSENQVKYYYYDSLGRPIENGVKDASGNILYRETCVYDDFNDMKTTTVAGDSSAPDQVTEEYYDEMGYLIRTAYQVGGRFYRNVYTYDYVGNLIRARLGYSAEGGVSEDTRYTYDFSGNVLSTTDALGNVSSKTYDWTGKQLTGTDPAGSTTQFSYDALGRLLKTEKPFAVSGDTTYDSVTIYEYDPNGNVITQKVSSNVPGETAAYRTTKYEYDSMGRLSTAILYAPETRYTQYYYDALGNVLRTYTGLHSRLTISGLDQVSGSDTDYAVTSYTYDSRSNLIKMTDALGQEETYTYKADGLVGTKVDRNGNTTAYSYDAMWRPLEVTVTNADGAVTDTMTYAYTANNLLRSQSNGSHTTTYTYDSFGHVVEEQTDGTTNASVYDTMGNRTKLVITVNGAVQSETNYTYDTLGRMTGMSNGTVTASYGYNANGSRSYVEYGNGNREEYIYNLGNCPVSVINKKGTTILSRYDYTYALDGNIVRTEESNGTVTTYSYDGMNQLVQETRAEFGAASQSLAYAYDDFGNRKTLTASGPENYTVSYTYDRNNRLLEDAKTEGGKVVRTSYFYDPNGNQT
ncbi:MAG: RHS repeat protein, partial [Oscillibacter sp.]|nr:RHS repeat protein [Oscillibacter sp.]